MYSPGMNRKAWGSGEHCPWSSRPPVSLKTLFTAVWIVSAGVDGEKTDTDAGQFGGFGSPACVVIAAATAAAVVGSPACDVAAKASAMRSAACVLRHGCCCMAIAVSSRA